MAASMFVTNSRQWPGSRFNDPLRGTMCYERGILMPDSWVIFDHVRRIYIQTARYDHSAADAIMALLGQVPSVEAKKPPSRRVLVVATVSVPDYDEQNLYLRVMDADRAAIAALAAYSAAIDTPLPWCWRPAGGDWQEVKL